MKTVNVDYHFHPNLSRFKFFRKRKIKKIYDAFKQYKIDAVLITEHSYKKPEWAYKCMLKYKPKAVTVFPGIEYTTKENIDIIMFSKNAKLYDYDLETFKLTYDDVLKFIDTHRDIYGYVTHPLTPGETGLVEIKGKKFEVAAASGLGAVEAHYDLFNLRDLLKVFPLRYVFKPLINKLKRNENLPKNYYPKHIKFLAGGSDAHFVKGIGNHYHVEWKGSVFKSVINNKKGKFYDVKKKIDIYWFIRGALTAFHEYLIKKIRRTKRK